MYKADDFKGQPGVAIKRPQKPEPVQPPTPGVEVNLDVERLGEILADPLGKIAEAMDREIKVEAGEARRLVPWDVEILRDEDGNIKKLRLTPVL